MTRRGMTLDFDDLPCACITTAATGIVTFVNRYFVDCYGWDRDAVEGAPVSTLFSKASQLFCDSYVIPTALSAPVCAEVQLTLLTPRKARRPVVASVRLLPDGGFVWILVEADNRKKLFDELTSAQNALEVQRQHLHEQSRTDALTGILNRRGLDDAVTRALAANDVTGEPFALILLDIDTFKTLNDTLGHQAGDAALIALGAMLGAECRRQDVVGRLGGDEFVCALPRTDLAGAAALCERIHRSVARRAGDRGGFTVSIGCVGLPAGHSMRWPEVLAAADAALYAAKAAGRNRTEIREA